MRRPSLAVRSEPDTSEQPRTAIWFSVCLPMSVDLWRRQRISLINAAPVGNVELRPHRNHSLKWSCRPSPSIRKTSKRAPRRRVLWPRNRHQQNRLYCAASLSGQNTGNNNNTAAVSTMVKPEPTFTKSMNRYLPGP